MLLRWEQSVTVPSVSLVVYYQGLLYLYSIQPQVAYDDTLGLGTVSVGDPRKLLWHLWQWVSVGLSCLINSRGCVFVVPRSVVHWSFVRGRTVVLLAV